MGAIVEAQSWALFSFLFTWRPGFFKRAKNAHHSSDSGQRCRFRQSQPDFPEFIRKATYLGLVSDRVVRNFEELFRHSPLSTQEFPPQYQYLLWLIP
jgi:hypothetical protein